MSEEKYFSLIGNMVSDSLLHLYLTVAESGGFVTTLTRNKILVSFIKPKLKKDKYKGAKIEIKRLLVIGRSRFGDLEIKLNDILEHVLREEKNMTDAHKFSDLIDLLKAKFNIDSRFIIENEKRKPKFIYVLKSHIENGFNEDGEQIAPISLFLESPKSELLEGMINDVGSFSAVTQEYNSEKQQVHVRLQSVDDLYQ